LPNFRKRSYYGIRNMSDKLCRENGLSVVVPGKGSKGKSYAEYQAEKTGTSWKGKLKTAVDALIPQVSSFEELLTRLQAAGYEIKPGKYVSCRAPGQERFTRLKTLGADYTEEAIRERIAGRRTKAAYLRKIAIDGYIIQIDHADIKAMTAEIQKIGVNVNQIARRVNATGNAYQEDIEEIKGVLAEIWRLQRLSLLYHIPLSVSIRKSFFA
jgi:hypothetical protein